MKKKNTVVSRKLMKNALSKQMDRAFCRLFKAVGVLLFLLNGVHRFVRPYQE